MPKKKYKMLPDYQALTVNVVPTNEYAAELEKAAQNSLRTVDKTTLVPPVSAGTIPEGIRELNTKMQFIAVHYGIETEAVVPAAIDLLHRAAKAGILKADNLVGVSALQQLTEMLAAFNDKTRFIDFDAVARTASETQIRMSNLNIGPVLK